jgi:hypothetical protein
LEGIDHVLEKELDVLEAGVSGLRGTPSARFAGLGTMAGAEGPVDTEDIKIIKALQEKAGATLEVDGPDDTGTMKKAAATYYPVAEKHCGPRGLITQPTFKNKKKEGAKFTIMTGTGNSKSKNFGCMVRFEFEIEIGVYRPPPYTHLPHTHTHTTHTQVRERERERSVSVYAWCKF